MGGFGDFEPLCAQSSLPICSLLGPPSPLSTNPNQPLLLTTCSARSIELGNTIIFQAATDFAHIGALIMTTIMILHVRSKFTAVGRKEILTFFYIYLVLTCISLVLDAGVLQATTSGVYPYFVAIQNGLTGALCISLMVNGFVGFQLYEDGTALSVWLLRGTSVGMFAVEFAVSLLTFKSVGGVSPEKTSILFVVLYIIPALFLFVYLVMQVFLVLNTLQDRWPLGDLLFGAVFFIVGQVLLYALGTSVCRATSHYLDALFFATMCNLLAVMMIYKYWDSITKEDLEFSVGTKQGNWEVKDPLLGADSEYDLNYPYDSAVPTTMSASKRASFYNISSGPHGGNNTRGSLLYDNPTATSLDYNPRPASGHQYLNTSNLSTNNPRLSGHGYAQPTNEAKQSYGDVRRSANLVGSQRPGSQGGQPPAPYSDFESTSRRDSSVRDRSGGRQTKSGAHGRVASEGVVYDRY